MPMLFIVAGSAGSGKSTALRELAARRRDLTVIDTDDWGPPPEQALSWWQKRLEVCIRKAVSAEDGGRDTVVAGWLTLGDVLQIPAARALEGIAVCLLDCTDSTRVQRIEKRAASGTWGDHRPEQIAHFLRAAEQMRGTEDDSLIRFDTSDLSVPEVVDSLERWIAEERERLGGRTRQA